MKIIGHRGARGLAPENTIASIKKALECRTDEIEIDVRVSKDGIPVLHHDPRLFMQDKTSPIINAQTFSELKKLKPDIATLDGAIKIIDKSCPVVIEVKPNENLAPIIKVIRKYIELGWRSDDFRLASFSQTILRNLHATFPEIRIIVNERWSGVRASIRARELGTTYITMNQRWLWFGFMRAMSKRGFHLTAYTLSNPQKVKNWSNFGLYGVITDYPDRFIGLT